MKKRWKKLRHRAEWLLLVIAAAIVPLLSRRGCARLGYLLGGIVSVLDRPGRRVALSNLEAAFGGELSSSQRAKIVRQSYQSFAAAMLDVLWSPRLTKENFRRYIEIENLERAEQQAGPDRCAIVICLHYGNFEWLSLALGFLGYPADIVAEKQRNPKLDEILQRARKRSGHTIVPRKGAIIHVYKTLRRRGRVAILIDLTVRPTHPAVVIKCFGLQTCVTIAHAWLHQRTGAPIIPAHCEPLPGGRYRMVCHAKVEAPAEATPSEIAQACWDCFEPIVRRNPAPWLWMYKHWRFKPEDADRPYPFYANISCHFQKLLGRLKQEAAGRPQPFDSAGERTVKSRVSENAPAAQAIGL
jgi:Kdo2-lipid IVA lauroyltransferase/acyltransferase